MNQLKYSISAYQAAKRTAPPLRAVVLLYDEILKRIALAAAAARRDDFECQFNEVMYAAKILNGLNNCLDMEMGGSVAVSLREMYQAVIRALLGSVGRNSGAEACDRLIDAVRLTRNAWAEISGQP
jgi:flagellar protein FliS